MTQLTLLEIIANNLFKSQTFKMHNLECKAILAGAMIVIREKIDLAKRNTILFNGYAPFSGASQSSIVHTELTKIIKLDTLTRADLEALITTTLNFIVFMTIDRTIIDDVAKESFKIKHCFSAIPNSELTDIMNLMQELITFCRVDVFEHCVKEHKKEPEASNPKESTSIYAKYWNKSWLGKKSPADSEYRGIVEEETEEKSEMPSGSPSGSMT